MAPGRVLVHAWGDMPPMLRRLLLCAVLIAAAAPGERSVAQEGPSRAEVFAQAKALSALGSKLFRDPSLSASGKLACASCHDPSRAFGPRDARPVEFGGGDMRHTGLRAVPSLRYLQAAPQFTEHYYESDDEGDASVDNGPTGGLTWDGRIDRGRDQARLPLLSPDEMANASPAAIVAALRRAPYVAALRRIGGAAIFDRPERAFALILEALEAYEQDYAAFYPYSSKYDSYLASKAALTPQEARGLALFNDPAKGNCAHCHPSARGNDGTPPQFTDYGFVALGVPRNRAIPANADPNFYDLGLCGPLRTDLRAHPDYCGLFKTPSLRNVATRKSFFHNGMFHSLKRAIEFYAERDTDPGKWYPRDAAGRVEIFDDLPPAYRANVNEEPPFGRHQGEKPALSTSEVADIAAFLKTLTDGYRPRRAARRLHQPVRLRFLDRHHHPADRPERNPDQLEMRPGKGDADDGDGEAHGKDEMRDRQPPPRQNEPNDVAEKAQRTGAEILLAGEARARHGGGAEGQECIERDVEGGARPGQADDGDCHQHARDHPADGHPQAAGQHPGEIEQKAQQRHEAITLLRPRLCHVARGRHLR